VAAERVRVPRLVSRELSMWLAQGAGLVGAIAVLVWGWTTQEENRPFVVVAVVFFLVVFTPLLWRSTWIDRTHGTVVRTIMGVSRRPVTWADAARVTLTSNRAGGLLLEVRGAGRRTSTYLPLADVGTGGDRSQEPGFLRLLADEVERWAPRHGEVVARLRGQADHLERGGDVRSSPLTQLIGVTARPLEGGSSQS
jgi:hypothetical protein